MIRRYNLSHPVGQPMPEDWIRLPDSVVAAADYDALAQLVCDLWHSSAAAYIPPWLQKRVRDVSHAQLTEEQRFLHGAAAVCQHGIRHPWECRECADEAWEKHKADSAQEAAPDVCQHDWERVMHSEGITTICRKCSAENRDTGIAKEAAT